MIYMSNSSFTFQKWYWLWASPIICLSPHPQLLLCKLGLIIPAVSHSVTMRLIEDMHMKILSTIQVLDINWRLRKINIFQRDPRDQLAEHFLNAVSQNANFTNCNSHDMTESFQASMGNSMLNKSKQISLWDSSESLTWSYALLISENFPILMDMMSYRNRILWSTIWEALT